MLLNELYHDDDMLQDSVAIMFSGFVLESYAHLTLGAVIEQYEANPQPLH